MKNAVLNKAQPTTTTSTLVIGWGNELLGDDGVGRHAARAVAAWAWPGVEALDIHQLAPELAWSVAESGRVIFVDAYPAEEMDRVKVSRLEPDAEGDAGGNLSVGHTGSPSAVLALALRLYGLCPEAWLIAVPACSFEPWASLSATAERGLAEALVAVKRCMEDER